MAAFKKPMPWLQLCDLQRCWCEVLQVGRAVGKPLSPGASEILAPYSQIHFWNVFFLFLINSSCKREVPRGPRPDPGPFPRFGCRR